MPGGMGTVGGGRNNTSGQAERTAAEKDRKKGKAKERKKERETVKKKKKRKNREKKRTKNPTHFTLPFLSTGLFRCTSVTST